MISNLRKEQLRYFLKISVPTILIILVLKIGLALLTIWQIKQTAADMQSQIAQVEGNATGSDLDHLTRWRQFRQSNQKLKREFLQLRIALWPLDRMGDSVSAYPWGQNWAGGITLLEIGEDLTATVSSLNPILGGVLMELDEGASPKQVIERVEGAFNRLEADTEAESLLVLANQIAQNRSKLEQLAISNTTLLETTDQLKPIFPLVTSGLLTIQALPPVAGFNAEHRVLILLQNADELRPTGGFITSSIYVVIQDGEIESIETLASNDEAIDHFAERYYTPPPAPYTQFMELRLWLFRDANWSPDFPTSAAKAASLYSYGRDVEVDTVVALNQKTLEKLLEMVGPLEIGEDELLSAENSQAFFQDLWTEYRRDSVGNRKLFISDLVPSIMTALAEITLDNQDFSSVAESFLDLAQSGDLLVYSADQDIQRWAEAVGLDGSIPSTTQDYLYPVMTNMGYDKSDFLMERELNYHVSLRKIAEPFGVLTLTAENKGLATPGLCPPSGDRPGMTYLQRATSCNVNYLRLYLPNRSELLRATQFEVPESHAIINEPNVGEMRPLVDERGHNVFGGVWITPPQMTNSGRFVYALHPAEVFRLTATDTLSYKLLVQKQPGVGEQPVQIVIDLPTNLPLKSVSPQPVAHSVDSLVFDLVLDRDLEIELAFKVASNQLEQVSVLLSDKPSTGQANLEPRFVPTQFPLELNN